MTVDWQDDYCDRGHVIRTLECGECVAERIRQLEEALRYCHDITQDNSRCPCDDNQPCPYLAALSPQSAQDEEGR